MFDVTKNCGSCEFYQGFCIGNTDYYGKDVDEDFTCKEWEMSFALFQDLCEVNNV